MPVLSGNKALATFLLLFRESLEKVFATITCMPNLGKRGFWSDDIALIEIVVQSSRGQKTALKWQLIYTRGLCLWHHLYSVHFVATETCSHDNMFSGKTAALKYSLVWPEPKRRKWKVQLAGHHANTKHINDFLTVMAAWILRRKVQISSDAGVHKESGFHACSEQLNFCCALLIAVTF